MKRCVLILLLTGLAAGCTQTVEEMDYSQRKALAQSIVQRCYDEGLKTGTPEMKACMQTEAQSEIARRDRRARIEDARRSSRPTICNRVGYTVICS